MKDITIIADQDTLDRVLQVEEATEGEEVIAGIMTEKRTIEEKKKRTIIPETIDSHESAKIIFILQYKYGRQIFSFSPKTTYTSQLFCPMLSKFFC